MQFITWTDDAIALFRSLIQKALAVHPEDKAVIKRASELVLAGEKIRIDEHGICAVKSQTRHKVAYQPNGACQCEAYAHGATRCAHRYAAAMYTRLWEAQHPHGAYSEAVRDQAAHVQAAEPVTETIRRTDRYGKATNDTFTVTSTVRTAQRDCDSIAARVCCPENRIAWWIGGHSTTAGK